MTRSMESEIPAAEHKGIVFPALRLRFGGVVEVEAPAAAFDSVAWPEASRVWLRLADPAAHYRLPPMERPRPLRWIGKGTVVDSLRPLLAPDTGNVHAVLEECGVAPHLSWGQLALRQRRFLELAIGARRARVLAVDDAGLDPSGLVALGEFTARTAARHGCAVVGIRSGMGLSVAGWWGEPGPRIGRVGA